jgi:hypothetical protein
MLRAAVALQEQKAELSEQSFSDPRQSLQHKAAELLEPARSEPNEEAVRNRLRWNQRQSINFQFRPDIQSYGGREVSGPVGRRSSKSWSKRRFCSAGIDVQVPLWTDGLLSARQNEATLRASAAASAKYDYQIDRVQLEYECGTLPYLTPGKVYRGGNPNSLIFAFAALSLAVTTIFSPVVKTRMYPPPRPGE